jgi:hypothetical protein
MFSATTSFSTVWIMSHPEYTLRYTIIRKKFKLPHCKGWWVRHDLSLWFKSLLKMQVTWQERKNSLGFREVRIRNTPIFLSPPSCVVSYQIKITLHTQKTYKYHKLLPSLISNSLQTSPNPFHSKNVWNLLLSIVTEEFLGINCTVWRNRREDRPSICQHVLSLKLLN